MSQNSPLIPDEEATAQPANQGEAVIDRILRRGARAAALGAESDHGHSDTDGDQFDLEDRSALRRVSGLSTELEDITEVEYRQLRLEKVLLIGLWGCLLYTSDAADE
jgi:GTP-binding protein HflX